MSLPMKNLGKSKNRSESNYYENESPKWIPQATDRERFASSSSDGPSTSNSYLSTSQLVAPVLQAKFPKPGSRREPTYYTHHDTDDDDDLPYDYGEGPSTSSSHPLAGATSSFHLKTSRWAMVREKSPQIISKEAKLQDKRRQLDSNKGRVRLKFEKSAKKRNEEIAQNNSFSDVVKTAMNSDKLSVSYNTTIQRVVYKMVCQKMLRTWISAMEHDERESEPERDRTTTNAEPTTENGDILPAPPVFVPRLSGWTQTKEYLKDKWLQLRYFYVTENSTFFYYWSALITIGIIYNMCAMVIFIFDDIHLGYFKQWLYINMFFDVCYILDCLIGSRLVYRLYEFIILTQRRTDWPHFMKILFLTTACGILFHWNACVYFLFSLFEGLTEDDTNAFGFSYYKVFDPRFPSCDALYDESCWYPEDEEVLDIRDERPKYMHQMYQFWKDKYDIFSMGNFSREYSMTLYWSSLTITKCGQQPWPSSSYQNALEIFDTLIGVLVFATIIGGVGSVVTQMSQNVNTFREMMDGIKFYMNYRGVQWQIQERVLNCFLYLNSHNQLYEEDEILSSLPPRIQAKIASDLHSETLSHVLLFSKCEQRMIDELVLLVKQQVFSPNDYLCRKGELAQEMFIVKKGKLAIIDDETGIELDVLEEGCTFGELSVIHVPGNTLGDRRSVSLRAIGYSDVFVLHKDDVSKLLNEYPEERVRLLENARRMLHSKGLLETNELGEMKCDDPEDMDDEALVDFMSVDEQLDRLERIVDGLNKDLNNRIISFSHFAGHMKQRVTSLEDTFNLNKTRIRSDLFEGILKTDYHDRQLLT
ncbi:Protein CBG16807 [Caenorhabditis briggsae]|uniref:Protein CBG16807 n=1 Tax=Caenorhabditis briggsae TaxID=6238 RepID=A8XPU6_CAEBR|nr:Protein CBG16807 [Caenorhabditis briggsae]CAP34672.1 Protein CBG16807 [Caenorhabditis briggsae]